MTESAIVRQILDWLAAERIFAFRLNTSATKIGDRFFRAHSLGPGAADILALPKINNRVISLMPVWIEVKTATGRQSSEQQSFQAYVQEMGHVYILARSVDDVRELIQSPVEKTRIKLPPRDPQILETGKKVAAELWEASKR